METQMDVNDLEKIVDLKIKVLETKFDALCQDLVEVGKRLDDLSTNIKWTIGLVMPIAMAVLQFLVNQLPK